MNEFCDTLCVFTRLCPSAASGDVQAYQIRTAPTSAITPGVVMATSPALGSGGGTEEVTRKREVRLMKNRYEYYEVDYLCIFFLVDARDLTKQEN